MDLIEEQKVKVVYEDQNIGSHKDALRKASAQGKQGRAVWRKLLRSIDRAYEIGIYGVEIAPIPEAHNCRGELHQRNPFVKLLNLRSP